MIRLHIRFRAIGVLEELLFLEIIIDNRYHTGVSISLSLTIPSGSVSICNKRVSFFTPPLLFKEKRMKSRS